MLGRYEWDHYSGSLRRLDLVAQAAADELVELVVVSVLAVAAEAVAHSAAEAQVLCGCRSLVVACVVPGLDGAAGVSVDHVGLVHWVVVVGQVDSADTAVEAPVHVLSAPLVSAVGGHYWEQECCGQNLFHLYRFRASMPRLLVVLPRLKMPSRMLLRHDLQKPQHHRKGCRRTRRQSPQTPQWSSV